MQSLIPGLPDTLGDWDPLVDRLRHLLLPTLEFQQVGLEEAIECLRGLANRALPSSVFPEAGSVSVALLIHPDRLARPITLAIDEGTTVWEALHLVATQAGLCVLGCNLGVLVCEPAAQAAIRADFVALPPQAAVPLDPNPLLRDYRLALVRRHPALALCPEAYRAWYSAYLASDRTYSATIRAADAAVTAEACTACECLAEIPIYEDRPVPPAER